MYNLKFIETIEDNKAVGGYIAKKGEIVVEVQDFWTKENYKFLIKDTVCSGSSSINSFIGVDLDNGFEWFNIYFEYAFNYEEIYEKLILARGLKLN